MRRSYLFIKANDFKIYENEEIFNADSIVINAYDASMLFANFEKFQGMFNKFREKNIKIYLEVDCHNFKKCYKAIDKTIGKYIGGFYIDNPLPKVLRHYSLKARDYELKQRLEFKTIDFMVLVDNLEKFAKLRKIIKFSRVHHLIIKQIDKVKKEYFQEKMDILQNEWHLDLISEKQLTYNHEELNKINHDFNIDKEKINKSLLFAYSLQVSSKKERKKILSKESIVQNYRLLNMAKRLGIIDDYPQLFFYRKKKKEKITKPPQIRNFYTLGEEIGNAVTHGVGAGLSIAALVILAVKGARSGNDKALLSYLIFAISSLLLYLMSTIYHALALGTKAKALFQKFDHLTIYLLIAGTYTPFSLLAISEKMGLFVCIFLWVGALVGSLLTIFAFGKYRAFHIILYILLGWIAIFFIGDIIANLHTIGVILLIAGGVTYTLGLIFYAMKFFKYTHMVWHIFVIIGTLLHFLSIVLYL